jgi:hypothetical protein
MIKMSFYKISQAEREFKIARMLRNEGGLGLRETRKIMKSYRILYKAWAEAKVAPLREYVEKKKMLKDARSAAAKKSWINRRSWA